ncbi:MAG: RecX family transcriptional regulator [Bacteroidales bacterium]|nr:RecX family transcriptional regulator [Bacteroidales bacterium]
MQGKGEEIGKVLDRLRRQCSRREYCSSDILRKAAEALGKDSDAASEVLRVLVEERYVDDLRYASAFARDKSSIAGWGEVKIRYMLSAKGVAKKVIDEALQEIDRPKADMRLEKLLENKWKTLKNDPQGKFKLIRFALGRGYGYEYVSSYIKGMGI